MQVRVPRHFGPNLTIIPTQDLHYQLESSLIKCKDFIEQSSFAMALTDGSEHLLRCANSAFCALHGRTVLEQLGRPIVEVIPQSVVESLLSLLDRVYLGTEGDSIKFRLFSTPEYHAVYRSYTAWAIPASEDFIRGLVIHVSDCIEKTPEDQRNIQSDNEMREINEQLLISSVRQHELIEQIAQAEQVLRDNAVVMDFQNTELLQANIALQELATTDGLTGLKNSRAFHLLLNEEIGRSLRYQLPQSLILIDVDGFKQFNDTFGHPEGDRALVEVSRILQDCARASDCVARYGGEEFALILPLTNLQGAVDVAKRIHAAFHSTSWQMRPITASFGCATLLPGEQANDLIGRADKALYRAKANGRDCIVLDTVDQE